MSKLLFTGIAVAIIGSTSAMAADLPTKAPVYKAAPMTDPGFFGSLTGGYLFQSNREYFISPNLGGEAGGFGPGWTGRGTVGYRWANNWDVAVGIEGANFKEGTSVLSYTGNTAVHAPKGNYYAVDGEVGYTFRSSTNFRLFAGPRYVRWAMSDADGQAVPFTFDQHNSGWGPRGGFEWSGPLGWNNTGWFLDGSVSYIFGKLTASAGGAGAGAPDVSLTKNYAQWDLKGGLDWQVAPKSKLAIGYQVDSWNGALAAIEYNGFGLVQASGSAKTFTHGPFLRYSYNY